MNQFDEAPIGNVRRKTAYGLVVGIGFKGIDVSVLLQGIFNRSIALTGASEWEFNDLFNNGQVFEHHLNRWTPETAVPATYPRISTHFNNKKSSNYLK